MSHAYTNLEIANMHLGYELADGNASTVQYIYNYEYPNSLLRYPNSLILILIS